MSAALLEQKVMVYVMMTIFSISKLNQVYFSRLSRFYIRHYKCMGTW